MRVFLICVAALFGFLTLTMVASSKSAIHEILAAVCALTAVCAIGMAGIIDAIRNGPTRPRRD